MKQWLKENQDAIIDAGMFLAIVIVVLLMLCLTSCTTTKYVPVETIKTDTLFKARKDSIRFITYYARKDSVHVRDSVAVKLDAEGNVARTDTWHWIERFKSERDSTSYYKALTDSLKNKKNNQQTKIVTVTKTVMEKYPMRKKIRIGVIALLAGFGVGVFRKKIVELVLKIIKHAV